MRLRMWQHNLPTDTAPRRPSLYAPAVIHNIQIERAGRPPGGGPSSSLKLDLLQFAQKSCRRARRFDQNNGVEIEWLSVLTQRRGLVEARRSVQFQATTRQRADGTLE